MKKKILVTIDPSTLVMLDHKAKEWGMSRSAYIETAVELVIQNQTDVALMDSLKKALLELEFLIAERRKS